MNEPEDCRMMTEPQPISPCQPDTSDLAYNPLQEFYQDFWLGIMEPGL